VALGRLDTDVIIAVAGPAGPARRSPAPSTGCACACSSGLSSQIKAPSGETSHPPIERLLRQFGLAERFQSPVGARHSGIWLSWEGVQDSTYRMGLRALGAVPEISQITIAKPNKHYILINLSVFQLDNPKVVLVPARSSVLWGAAEERGEF
jgi:hypothetical protein